MKREDSCDKQTVIHVQSVRRSLHQLFPFLKNGSELIYKNVLSSVSRRRCNTSSLSSCVVVILPIMDLFGSCLTLLLGGNAPTPVIYEALRHLVEKTEMKCLRIK